MTERIQQMAVGPLRQEDVPAFLQRFAGNINQRLRGLEQSFFEKTYAQPSAIAEGTVRYADGTYWNPGFGEGWYQYRSSAWVFIGGAPPLSSVSLSATSQAGATGVLKSYTVAAGLLAANNVGFHILAAGTKTGTGGTATVGIRTGTTPTSRRTFDITGDATTWSFDGVLFRTGATTALLSSVVAYSTEAWGEETSANISSISTDTNWVVAQTIDFYVSVINAADTVTQNQLVLVKLY